MQSAGISVPSLATLADYHPQFALAVLAGVPVRPNLRPLSQQLQNSQLGQPQPASFDQVIGQYSIFSSCQVSIDPTNNLDGNPLKYLSDAAQALVTGVTVTMMVDSRSGINYTPIPDETPLQVLPAALSASAGIWRMVNPENLKVKFTVAAAAQSSPFTVWLNFTFLMLAAEGEQFLCVPTDEARRRLCSMGCGSMRGPVPVQQGAT
jgi:hypothetical protein